jgi:hypothetical protein
MRLGLGNTLALTNNGSSNPDALSLNLDFATDKSFSKPTTVAAGETVINARKGPSPVFSRASGGTMVGSDGLIQYSPENLLTYSQQFENTSGWLQTLGSAISNTIVAPDGSLTGDTLKANAVSYGGILRRAVNVPYTTSTQYTFSIYAKAGTKSTLGVRVSGNSSSSSGNYFSYFSLTGSGSATILAPQDAGTINSMTCTAVGDGWYKCVMTYTTAETLALVGDTTDLCITTTTGQTNYIPADTDTIYIWGAQVERSSTARQYIPTTTAVVYGPRFDHEPLSPFACKGLLIEESSANLSWYSKAIVGGTGWNLTEVTSTLVSTPVSPDGSSPYGIEETANSSGHAAANVGGSGSAGATSVVTGTAYTGSIFLRKVAGSVDWIQLTMSGVGFGTTLYANFNLSDGTAGNYSGLTAGTIPQIVSCGNGWYRCSITATAAATTATSGNIIVAFTNNTNGTQRLPSYLGSTANKVLANMCQFEAKAFPTSYIPTTSGTAPRSADLCSITSSAFTSFYNQPAGTVIANIYSCNGIYSRFNSFGAGRALELYKNSNGIDYYDGTNTNSITLSATYPCKVGVTSTLNDSIGVFNGVLSTTKTSLTMSSPTYMNIGCYLDATLHLNGCIRSIKYYKKRLPNAKLQSLTT